MDQQLLNALDNLSVALEQLATSLNSKNGEAQSPVATALQSGDFSNQMIEINKGIQSIKKDTQKILDNQETLLKMQKNQESKDLDVFEQSGKKKELIKDGVGSILLIAGAVLAIGMAFSLIGTVDWKSVLALSISLPLIAIAFEKISEMKLDAKTLMSTVGSLVVMSLGVLAASYILSKIPNVTIQQGLTAVMITAVFALMLPNIAAMISALMTEEEIGIAIPGMVGLSQKKKSLEMGTLLKASVMLPAIMVGASLGILASSIILSKVVPLDIPKALTAIGISVTFIFIAKSLSAIISALTTEVSGDFGGNSFKSKGFSMGSALAAAMVLPAIMFFASTAIMLSSHILSLIKPLTIEQGLTAIAISIVSVFIAKGTAMIISSFDDIGKAFAVVPLLPTLMVFSSVAIALSSNILQLVTPISFEQGLTAIAISVIGVFLAYSVSKIGDSISDPKKAAITAAFLPVLMIGSSLAIAGASSILSQVVPIGWDQGVTAIMISIAFAAIAFGLGPTLKAFSNLTPAQAFTASLVLPLIFIGISAAIVGSSHLISMMEVVPLGTLFNFVAVGISIAIVGLVAGLVMVGLSKLGSVKDYIMGGLATIIVSGTIAISSLLLNMGTYEKYPDWKWALGVGLSLGAFGLGAVLLGAVAMSPTFYMGLGAVLLVAGSIVATSYILGAGDYTKYPSLEWAGGVGLIMAGFSVGIIALALASPFILIGSAAMLMLSGTILAIDSIFESGNFNKYPSEEWSKGVKNTILGFVDLMGMMSIGSAIKGAISDLFGGGLTDIAESIVEIDTIFSKGDFTKYPSLSWGNGVLNAIAKFNQIKNALGGGGSFGDIFKGNDLEKTVSSISQLAIAFDKLGKAMTSFANSISSIDNEKLTAIKSLSSTVVLMSLLDPDQFEDMMDAMEEKSGIFGEFIEEFNNSRKEAESGGFFSSFKSPTSDKPKSDADILGPKLDKISAVLADISTVVGSKGTLKSYLNSKSKEVNLTPTKK
jgi:hypothetical protein